jgi:hypothetical protein
LYWTPLGDVAGSLMSNDLAMNRDESDKLTVNEFLSLFGRIGSASRWMGAADSEEYLTVVTYFVERRAA